MSLAYASVGGADLIVYGAPTGGVAVAALDEPEILWWARDGGLADASIVRVAIESGGRIAAADSDGRVFVLAARTQ